MEIMHTFDFKNYNEEWNRIKRVSVRAIIFYGDKIALIKNEKEGYYKFPGGGVEENETEVNALTRETREEAGLKILPTKIVPYGAMREIRKRLYRDEIFDFQNIFCKYG